MKALVAWSSGKDSALALHELRMRSPGAVAGLLTTVNAPASRVAMHGVRRELLELQAEAAGLPLTVVELPWPCSNRDYEAAMGQAIAAARSDGVTHMVFGDLFLEDIRSYRERQLAGAGIEPLFPLWCGRSGTAALASRMLGEAFDAIVCTAQAPLEDFLGRPFSEIHDSLPAGVDPCGENGEFHTFCHTGPVFDRVIGVSCGSVRSDGSFAYIDLLPAAGEHPAHFPFG